MRERERRKFHARLKHLREQVPLSLPVSVRISPCPQKPDKLCGFTTFDGAKLTIKIHPAQSYASAVETLIHEWAHARVICMGFEHKEAWGQEYARAYEADEMKRTKTKGDNSP